MTTARRLRLVASAPASTSTSASAFSASSGELPSVQECVREIHKSLDAESIREAERKAEWASARFPMSPAIRMTSGQVALAAGRPERAVLEFKRALQLNPNLSEAELLLGCALSELGRHDEALPFLERAVAALESLPRQTRQKTFSAAPVAKVFSGHRAAEPQRSPRAPTGQENGPDFIIGSLCSREGTSMDGGEALMTPSEVAVIRPDKMSVPALAAELRHWLGHWSQSPISRANALFRTFETVNPESQLELASAILCQWPDSDLLAIAFEGLRYLRKAAAQTEHPEDSVDLRRIDKLLQYVFPLKIRRLNNGAMAISQCHNLAAERAFSELEQMTDVGHLPIAGAVFMVLPREESATPKVVIHEYLQRVAPLLLEGNGLGLVVIPAPSSFYLSSLLGIQRQWVEVRVALKDGFRQCGRFFKKFLAHSRDIYKAQT